MLSLLSCAGLGSSQWEAAGLFENLESVAEKDLNPMNIA